MSVVEALRTVLHAPQESGRLEGERMREIGAALHDVAREMESRGSAQEAAEMRDLISHFIV